ncbi:MAG: alpha/beta fold hydrolase [Candidatus Poribacteria bacterium]
MTAAVNRATRICATLCVLIVATITLAQDADVPEPFTAGEFAIVQDAMGYDAGIPLDAAIVGQTEFDTQTRYKVVFRGSRDEMVPGYMSIPKQGARPFPCVLLLHGYGSRKERWWEDTYSSTLLTERLIALGYAIFALDAKYHGERTSLNNYEPPSRMFGRGWNARLRSLAVETTIDYRRGLDWLETREEIDTERVGAIGYSMGGMMVFYLAALDERVDVAVACVPPMVGSPLFAPIRVASHTADTPFALLVGADDGWYDAALAASILTRIPATEKTLKVYDSGHRLPAEYVDDAVEWVRMHLE